MDKREIIIILNRLRDVAESEDVSAKLTLNQYDSSILLKYLLELKKYHEKDVSLVNEIITSIERSREN
jgi:hypothetical protein